MDTLYMYVESESARRWIAALVIASFTLLLVCSLHFIYISRTATTSSVKSPLKRIPCRQNALDVKRCGFCFHQKLNRTEVEHAPK